jgi:zinc transport system substrate-binding protein
MLRLIYGAFIVLASLGASQAAPKVVVTVKPIHSLVAAVMEGVGTPALIVKGGASPHTYSLKPSDARALEEADVVFWTGHGMEVFLEDSIETLAPNARIVALSDSPALELLPIREGGAFEPHADDEDHDHEGEEHADEHGEMDMHYWLDPVNAEVLVASIADALVEADPENRASYEANAEVTAERLRGLATELTAILAPVKDKPIVVFHDAYQYLERRFGLAIAGSVTVSPETMPGAQRIAELRDKLKTLGAACIFAEPQFEPAVVGTIASGTGAKTGTLDPEGAGLTEGAGLYAELLTDLARSIADCLE